MRVLLFLFPLVLIACESTPGSPRGTASGRADGDALPDTAMVREVTLESTTDLVSGDLDRVSPSVAIQTLDLWIARLDTVSAEGAPAIRSDLTTLRNLLQSSPLDGLAIGETLRSLGEGTGALAADDRSLARLAQTLRATGARLAPDTSATDRGTEAP